MAFPGSPLSWLTRLVSNMGVYFKIKRATISYCHRTFLLRMISRGMPIHIQSGHCLAFPANLHLLFLLLSFLRDIKEICMILDRVNADYIFGIILIRNMTERGLQTSNLYLAKVCLYLAIGRYIGFTTVS